MNGRNAAPKAIDICKRNELWALIKRVSEYHGGDDPAELKAFAKEMVEKCTLDECLDCFRDLANHCNAVPKSTASHPTGIEPPKELKYQPPFVKNC